MFDKLYSFEDQGAKFLFNVYIPKGDGKTTEIDVLMICNRGLFVFESKNYAGWIFGKETRKNWVVSLHQGYGRSARKARFYNPIRQNAAHVQHLRNFVNKEIPTYSIIVFSNECTFKYLNLKSKDIAVIYRCEAFETVSKIYFQAEAALSQADIDLLFYQLFPYSQVSREEKKRHAEQIRNR